MDKTAHINKCSISFDIPSSAHDLTKINGKHPNVDNIHDELLDQLLSLPRASETYCNHIGSVIFIYDDVGQLNRHYKTDARLVQSAIDMAKIKADRL